MATIVVAEDDDELRLSLARFLRSRGHDVLEAASGRGVVEATRMTVVDLVVADVLMPDVDGLALINELRREGAGVPLIAISGGGRLSKPYPLQTAEALGAFAVFEKPFDYEELGQAVDDALRSEQPPATR